MITLAVLDIAGTTVEEGGTVYRVLADVVAEHGPAAPDHELRRWMGADKRAALAALTGDPAATEELHARFVERLNAAYAALPPVPVAGVPQALAQLRSNGVRVALTTGFDHAVTDPLLAAVGWRTGEHLDAVVCAEDVDAGRPSPDMIRRAMRLTGVTDPLSVVTAGDTVLDIQAGHAAGAGLVTGVLSGAQTRAELEREKPAEILESVAGLPALILSYRNGAGGSARPS
ncbi:phosphonatase-like hydrolase [Paractinoplanes lichenicola]|uniref:Phosphonatase-like hydrolase n=1 Tax=Paractinoplanes lichenicola TaxID=2802976 RepID=A0ABS1W669_9ACTN|nr:phosphonatase-like hydrolase [Actinoplanes lichenicola]MBL7262213.1 phosphonatase-like hydrolase [Actinoplanes lichenicola]